MPLDRRIIAPVLVALVCVGLLLALLWWQLTQASTILTKQPTTTGPIVPTGTPVESVDLDPRDVSLLYLHEGDLLAFDGQWTAAQEAYEKAVDSGGGLPAMRKLAQAQLQRRDYVGARDSIKKLRQAGARTEDILLLETIVDLRTGELVKARAALEEAADSPQKSYGLVLLAVAEGNHEQAQILLKQVQDGWEPILRSYAQILQAAYDEFALFPDSPDIHLITLLSRALAQVQECELALPLLLQVTGQQPDYRDAWIVQGYCELTTERSDEALISFQQAYTIDPQKPEIQYFLGRAHLAQNDAASALTFFQYALINGFTPELDVRSYIAEAAEQTGDIALATEELMKLVEPDDAAITTFQRLVRVLIDGNNVDDATRYADAAVERFPDDGRSHELRGWALVAADNGKGAKPHLEKALSLNPQLKKAKALLKEIED